MERAQTCPEPLPRTTQHPLLADESSSVFREGFYSPSVAGGRTEKGLCWRAVREVIEMADNALKAKQRAAEQLQRQVEVLQQRGASDKLLQRAQRAEVDCGSLVDELQQLIRAKSDVAQQRADLDRANALLMAERELLCEQLQVPPESVNLCQAVSKVLATAKRAKALDSQLRLLAKCQRELLLQLEAQREAAARAERGAQQWQAEKQALLQVLAEHGIKQPELPVQQQASAAASPVPAPTTAADSAATEPVFGLTSSGSLTSSSAALMAQLMLMRMHSASSASCPGADPLSGSLQAQLPPGTPPVHDLGPAGPRPVTMLPRSHSLDSGLNSLTGLLDQLALGQLCGSEEDTEHMYDDAGDSESWALMDTLSADTEPERAGPAAAAGAGAGGASSSSSSHATLAAALAAKDAHLHQHQHLQPVQEGPEDC